ncbi:MAG: sulfur carrier protein ThiS [Prevotella sp.]|nr:sulfur carrier protein ThiS [Prevotella sp.]MDE6151632.1 sulfur carrier protein ThiS [Prevotella sp.]
MQIKINNKSVCTEASNMQELAQELNLSEYGVAMALGTSMVPRDIWSTTELQEGDSVIVIKAACGG